MRHLLHCLRPLRAPSVPSRWLLLAALLLTSAGCLQGEKVTTPRLSCSCYGLRCLEGQVARLSSNNENAPCRCHVDVLGMCADGCGASMAPIDGCQVASACRTWVRAAEGSECTTDRECEPGELRDGKVLQLACVAGRCARSEGKWGEEVALARQCTGAPEFGPHPACDGAPCVAGDSMQARRFCAAARCVDDRDCPGMWKCRCAEEWVDDALRAHRWCAPNLEAGFPENRIQPLEDASGP